MATTNPIADALALFRQRRLELYEVARLRNLAIIQRTGGVAALNEAVQEARAAWAEARQAVIDALLEPVEP